MSDFVGREEELARLRAGAEQAASGTPQLVLVEGEAGIGKTALVRYALQGMARSSVWWSSCDPAEQDLPYSVVEQWLRQAAPPLVETAPVLADGPDPSAAPVAVGAALLEMIGGQAQNDGLLVLVVDDVQWADEQSLQVLGFVLRRLWADRVLVVATARTGPREEGEDWRRLARQAPHAQEIRLGGLTETAIGELAVGLRDRGLSVAGARRLWEHTGGHPLYVSSVLAAVAQWEQFEDPGTILPVPDTLAGAVRQTLATLPPSSQELAQAMAVLDTRVPLTVAAQVASSDDPVQALGPLLESGLATWEASEPTSPVRIAHPLQREAVYQSIPPVRRRDLHTAAAAVVDTDTAWTHRVAAANRTDPHLAHALEAEAHHRTEAGYLARAATLLRWAADLSDTRPAYERRLLAAAIIPGFGSAHGLTVTRSLRQLVQNCAPCAARTHLQGLYAYLDGDYPGAIALIRQAIEQAQEAGDTATLTLARCRLGFAYHAGGMPREAGEVLSAVINDAPAGTEELTARWLLDLALLATATPGEVLKHPWITALPDDPQQVKGSDTLALLSRGYARITAGQPRAARDDLSAVLDPTRTHGTVPLARVHAHFNLACCHYLLGDWDRATTHAEQALAEGETGSNTVHFVPGHSWAAIIAAGRGRLDTARHHIDALSEHRIMPSLADLPALARAALAQAQSDPHGMLHALQPLQDIASDTTSTWLPNLHFWPTYTEALIGTGNLDRAEKALAHLNNLSQNTPCLHSITAWCTGQLAEAHGDPTAALAAYQARLDQPPDLDAPPLHQARLEHAAARLHLTHADRDTGTRLLRQAHDRFNRLGAAPFAARIAADLAAVNPAPDAMSPDAEASHGLTDREDTIAHLALQGLTNQEIGRELYISAKTVEYHLGHVYEKLGINSRRKLRTTLTPA